MRAADVITIKIVAVPIEHGASVMLGESLVAGLIVGASSHGFLPALAWPLLYFMGHPLKLALKDLSQHVHTRRTSIAFWCMGVFGFLSLSAFLVTYVVTGKAFLLALSLVIPFGLSYVWATMKYGKKDFVAELFGAFCLGAGAASIVLASGRGIWVALALWAVLAIRALTSIVYVRARLSQLRGNMDNTAIVIWVHTVGVFLLGALVKAHVMKPVILLAIPLLLLRLWFIYKPTPVSAKGLGLQESVLGIAFVLVSVLSF